MYDHSEQRRDGGTRRATLDALRRKVRVAAGRGPLPGIDGQMAEAGGERAYDGGKKLGGRERNIVADVPSLPPAIAATTASVGDGTGARRFCGGRRRAS